ncbi:hypothetical protein LXL04_030444 [Taraxacum kok-saghyz]
MLSETWWLWGGRGNTIPFFVAGMSDSTKKVDLRKCFAGFGELVDVYMGKSKNAGGRNFAFVKFANVTVIFGMEEKMQGMVCGGRKLTVNLSRYGRDRAPIVIPTAPAGNLPMKARASIPPMQACATGTSNRVWSAGGSRTFADIIKGRNDHSNYPPVNHAKPACATGTSNRVWSAGGSRTFADIIKGRNDHSNYPPVNLAKPVLLSVKNGQRNWVTDSVLVGEVLSLDHMAALPEQFLNGDGVTPRFFGY